MRTHRRRRGMSTRPRIAAEVFTRDRWACHWCTYPVVFAPALKYLQEGVRRRGCNVPLAYYHFNFARLYAPLLNDLAAVIDQVQAGSRAGPNDLGNLVTACNRCNTLKRDLDAAVWQKLTEEFRELRNLQNRAPDAGGMGLSMVGVAGFEPAAPCSQSRCATGLRHAPIAEREPSTPSISNGQQRADRAHRGAAVIHAMLLGGRELAERAAERRIEEDGVVAEPAAARSEERRVG